MSEEKEDKGKLIAILDGAGKTSTFGLYREYKNGDVEDIPWPKEWPKWVSIEFVEDAGYEVYVA